MPPVFIKKSENLKNFTKALGKSVEPARIPVSPGAISPGDVLYFKYGLDEVVVLVAGNKRSKIGIFPSSQNNRLLSCFKLSHKSGETINLILNALYKKRKKASYQVVNSSIQAGLKMLLGKDSYRTYKLTKMKHLQKLSIK